MDEIAALFSAGNAACTDANMDLNGLDGSPNLERFLVYHVVSTLAAGGHLTLEKGSAEQATAERLVRDFRSRVDAALRQVGLGALAGHAVTGWERLPEPGTYAHLGGFPCDAAVRYRVGKVTVACAPGDEANLEGFLLLASFERQAQRHAERIVASTTFVFDATGRPFVEVDGRRTRLIDHVSATADVTEYRALLQQVEAFE